MHREIRIYTVAQINLLVKAVLEQALPSRLIVRGELSDFSRHRPSGHCYFSLRDESGILPCVMWASRARAVKFEPEDGMAVLATGHIDVYSAGGKYQLYIDKLEPEGVGALQLAFEQMVKRLRAEGLFAEEHKKPLPSYPQRIGILTSESGAAVHDIADSIHNRWPCVRLFLYPVPVQGEGAAAKIAAALRDINRRNHRLKLDVLIVGRGGGSLEDLWAFNEEILARAVYDCEIPIISAVGHEVDTTIADLVADARASTPTKAGVVAVPDMSEVLARLASFERTLVSRLRAGLDLSAEILNTILASWLFRNPMSIVFYAEQHIDELSMRMTDAARALLADARQTLADAYGQVVRIEPHRLLAKKTAELIGWQTRAGSAVGKVVNDRRMQLTAAENRLQGLNPRSVLQRGYSITTNKQTGRLIKKPDDVQIGDLIITELAEKKLLESKVTKK